MSHSHIVDLLAQAEGGSREASNELFDKYGKYVLRAVRSNLNDRLRHLLDSQDLVQSVWATLLETRENLGTFETPADLIGFLTTVARRKAAYKARQYLGGFQKTNETRVVSLDADDESSPLETADKSPYEQVIIQYEWHRVMNGLNDRNQRILELRRDGHTMREIASILKVTERTVQRVMEDVSHRHQRVAVAVAAD